MTSALWRSRKSCPTRFRTGRVQLDLEYLEIRSLPRGTGAPAGQLQAVYGQVPLRFEANQGQTDPQVRFLARGQGYALFLTGTEAVLSLQKPAALAPGIVGPNPEAKGTVLRMQLVGGKSTSQGAGVDRLAGTSNYFVGNDPRQWHTAVPTYGRVAYHNVYAGIDLVYYGNQQQLEYDFTVAPGANPGLIQLNFEGAQAVTLDGQGDLVLSTAGGDVVEHAPVSYQDGAGGRQVVAGRFVMEGGHQVGFAVGAYDRTRPLIIDPTLSYSTYLGGSGSDSGMGIAVDSAGNTYVTGAATSSNFPTTSGAFQTTLASQANAFVTKLNAQGTALVYSTYLGGRGINQVDQGTAIAVDSAGNAYVIGLTSSSNFPTTAGAFQTTLGGFENAFVTKLNPSGTALVYSTYLGGSGVDFGTGIVVDSATNAYVTGDAGSSNFPTTPGAFQTTRVGSFENAFVTKLNPGGTALVYSTYLGGSGVDFGRGIVVDSAANAYITGMTSSSNFPTTPGAFQTTFGGTANAFVTKLNANGTGLVYSTYLGGSSNTQFDQGTAIAVDSAGNAYVIGLTSSSNFPTTAGAFQTTLGGFENAFVTKLNPSGTALLYSTYFGGRNGDFGEGIAVDAAGNAYITGGTNSSDFPITAGAFQTTLKSSQGNAFVTKLTLVSPVRFFAVGGSPGRVLVYKPDNTLVADFAPYGSSYTGPIAVAVGDINGDGYYDLVTGATVGNPDVRVYDGKAFATATFDPADPDASLIAQWFPYGLNFNVGANVAVGDVEDNGYADIVTGATAGNPDVRVYRGKDIATGTFNPNGASLIAQWFPYALQFDVGVNVAVGDVTGDHFADVVTGATAGNPDVRVYNGKDIALGTFNPVGSSVLAQFFPYALGFNVGAFVAVGDTTKSGFGDVITGASVGNPDVRVYSGQDIAKGTFNNFNPDASLRDQFFAYGLDFNIGAAVASADFENNRKYDILTGASAGEPHYRVVKGNATGTQPPALFENIPGDLQGGLLVGA
jgi:hypothetical protein